MPSRMSLRGRSGVRSPGVKLKHKRRTSAAGEIRDTSQISGIRQGRAGWRFHESQGRRGLTNFGPRKALREDLGEEVGKGIGEGSTQELGEGLREELGEGSTGVFGEVSGEAFREVLGEDFPEGLGEVSGRGSTQELGEDLGEELGEGFGEGLGEVSGEELGEVLREGFPEELGEGSGEVLPQRGCQSRPIPNNQLPMPKLAGRVSKSA